MIACLALLSMACTSVAQPSTASAASSQSDPAAGPDEPQSKRNDSPPDVSDSVTRSGLQPDRSSIPNSKSKPAAQEVISGSKGPNPKRSASQVRRPTKPTAAEGLEVRPPKPKFLDSATKRNTDVFDLTFDDLAFDIKDGEDFRWSMITPEIHQYDGAKVTLRGYIRPSFSQRNLKQFVFVRDNQECCFGPGAALFDCVLVKMAEGAATDYTVRPVTIEGEFYLRKYAGPDGNVWAIYRLKDGRIK
jgi:hypothetical protein